MWFIYLQAGATPAPELEATMKIMQTCLDMLDSISGNTHYSLVWLILYESLLTHLYIDS